MKLRDKDALRRLAQSDQRPATFIGHTGYCWCDFFIFFTGLWRGVARMLIHDLKTGDRFEVGRHLVHVLSVRSGKVKLGVVGPGGVTTEVDLEDKREAIPDLVNTSRTDSKTG